MPAKRLALGACLALLLGACASAPPAPPPPDVPAMVAAIRAAGQREASALEVTPLRDAGVRHLVRQASQARANGHYQRAASLIDQALALAPGAPDLLQARAVLAIYLHHYARAEQLARASWQRGPRLGSLCARNWQTVMEMRYVARDEAGIAMARKRRDACRVKPVVRM
jgi:hypothetical protein